MVSAQINILSCQNAEDWMHTDCFFCEPQGGVGSEAQVLSLNHDNVNEKPRPTSSKGRGRASRLLRLSGLLSGFGGVLLVLFAIVANAAFAVLENVALPLPVKSF